MAKKSSRKGEAKRVNGALRVQCRSGSTILPNKRSRHQVRVVLPGIAFRNHDHRTWRTLERTVLVKSAACLTTT